MRSEQLQSHFLEILAGIVSQNRLELVDETEVSLSDEDMFKLWNQLGEELGIDLSIATSDQRKLLFDACDGGRRISPKHFGSLLWLVYYAETPLQ